MINTVTQLPTIDIQTPLSPASINIAENESIEGVSSTFPSIGVLADSVDLNMAGQVISENQSAINIRANQADIDISGNLIADNTALRVTTRTPSSIYASGTINGSGSPSGRGINLFNDNNPLFLDEPPEPDESPLPAHLLTVTGKVTGDFAGIEIGSSAFLLDPATNPPYPSSVVQIIGSVEEAEDGLLSRSAEVNGDNYGIITSNVDSRIFVSDSQISAARNDAIETDEGDDEIIVTGQSLLSVRNSSSAKAIETGKGNDTVSIGNNVEFIGSNIIDGGQGNGDVLNLGSSWSLNGDFNEITGTVTASRVEADGSSTTLTIRNFETINTAADIPEFSPFTTSEQLLASQEVTNLFDNSAVQEVLNKEDVQSLLAEPTIQELPVASLFDSSVLADTQTLTDGLSAGSLEAIVSLIQNPEVLELVDTPQFKGLMAGATIGEVIEAYNFYQEGI